MGDRGADDAYGGANAGNIQGARDGFGCFANDKVLP